MSQEQNKKQRVQKTSKSGIFAVLIPLIIERRRLLVISTLMLRRRYCVMVDGERVTHCFPYRVQKE
eukprot:scaffold936_cov106-Amphora_coffeaeformis.AAC.5